MDSANNRWQGDQVKQEGTLNPPSFGNAMVEAYNTVGWNDVDLRRLCYGE